MRESKNIVLPPTDAALKDRWLCAHERSGTVDLRELVKKLATDAGYRWRVARPSGIVKQK